MVFRDPPKDNFRRSQTLIVKDGVRLDGPLTYTNQHLRDRFAPYAWTANQEEASVKGKPAFEIKGQAIEQKRPEDILWRYRDGVLKFFAYSLEPVIETKGETSRVRKFVVYFYMMDESIQVIEPRQTNSGIIQGVFLKRHRVQKADSQPFSYKDFNLGSDIVFYGTSFHIYDADEYTKAFFKAVGQGLKPAETVPEDQHEKRLAEEAKRRLNPTGPPHPAYDELRRWKEASLGRPSHLLVPDYKKQFLQNDRKVLRFYCSWDDRRRLYGDRHKQVLHYYLADDTVEILELSSDSGSASINSKSVSILNRQKIPKVQGVAGIGSSQFLSPRDLQLGSTVDVFGRQLYIYDCDDFTRSFFERSFGVVLGSKDTPRSETNFPPAPETPPHNDFGNPEDSILNTKTLFPRPPQKDYIKFIKSDHQVLAFEARMDTTHPFDRERRFIVRYFCVSDEIEIQERPQENSGYVGGKFLQRSKVRKPNTTPAPELEYYAAPDMYVGAVIEVFRNKFILLEADEYTYTFMEFNTDFWPMSSIDHVLPKVQSLSWDDLRKTFQAVLKKRIDSDQFFDTLSRFSPPLYPQELKTIVRHFSKAGFVNVSEFLKVAVNVDDHPATAVPDMQHEDISQGANQQRGLKEDRRGSPLKQESVYNAVDQRANQNQGRDAIDQGANQHRALKQDNAIEQRANQNQGAMYNSAQGANQKRPQTPAYAVGYPANQARSGADSQQIPSLSDFELQHADPTRRRDIIGRSNDGNEEEVLAEPSYSSSPKIAHHRKTFSPPPLKSNSNSNSNPRPSIKAPDTPERQRGSQSVTQYETALRRNSPPTVHYSPVEKQQARESTRARQDDYYAGADLRQQQSSSSFSADRRRNNEAENAESQDYYNYNNHKQELAEEQEEQDLVPQYKYVRNNNNDNNRNVVVTPTPDQSRNSNNDNRNVKEPQPVRGGVSHPSRNTQNNYNNRGPTASAGSLSGSLSRIGFAHNSNLLGRNNINPSPTMMSLQGNAIAQPQRRENPLYRTTSQVAYSR